MLTFTCITDVRNSTHITQHFAPSAEIALREHISKLPYDDGTGPFEEELEWLQSVAGGTEIVTMHPLGHCKNTWMWREGARFDPQYLTYVVQTDIAGN